MCNDSCLSVYPGVRREAVSDQNFEVAFSRSHCKQRGHLAKLFKLCVMRTSVVLTLDFHTSFADTDLFSRYVSK